MTTTTVKPAVLMNRPTTDAAGNRLQEIRLRFICGHELHYYSLNMGKGWKPRSNAQLMREELRISCPIGNRLCRACSES